MCGIVGAAGKTPMRRFLLRGLEALEYRGYDSAGLAFADSNSSSLRRAAAAGRVAKLRRQSAKTDGRCGVGHTRWATHGAPTAKNAHPIVAGRAAVVHNGIIENHAALRAQLQAAGRVFHTDTDTEVAAHLLDIALEEGAELAAAMRKTAEKLRGTFALAAVAAGGEEIAVLRRGSPLIVGLGDNAAYVASDAQAMQGAADKVAYLEDGDCGVLSAGRVVIWDSAGKKTERAWRPPPPSVSAASLGEHRHFMQKEIFEQPFSAAAAAGPYVDREQIVLRRFGAGAAQVFRRMKSVLIVACGSSHHAAMVAQSWLHRLGVPCRAEIASECRYCPPPHAESSLAVAVSQSGETADTLSAFRAAKEAGAATLALTNVADSAMARAADFVIPAAAGPEIGVAATKSFTSQLTQLMLLSLAIAKARRCLPPEEEKAAARAALQLPNLIQRALLLEDEIREWAREFAAAPGALFVGRRAHYPLALEGALKMKEISYLRAEGCAAGELKHGLLALIDQRTPVVGLAPSDSLLPKIASNLAEVSARGGRLFILAGDSQSADNAESDSNSNSKKTNAPNNGDDSADNLIAGLKGAKVLRLRDGGDWVSPMVHAIPLQLLAYHTALIKGTDIDKPRNLAKSVTVE